MVVILWLPQSIRYTLDVLDKYDKDTTRMKKEYEIEIQKHPDFNDNGWILSEFCNNNFDCKQLTSATSFKTIYNEFNEVIVI